MTRNDTTDFLAAFTLGGVLGLGAVLLTRREKRAPGTRVVRRKGSAGDPGESRPAHGESRRRGRATRRRSRAAGKVNDEFVAAGRELLREFRGEVASILSDARGELEEMTRGQARRGKRRPRA